MAEGLESIACRIQKQMAQLPDKMDRKPWGQRSAFAKTHVATIALSNHPGRLEHLVRQRGACRDACVAALELDRSGSRIRRFRAGSVSGSILVLPFVCLIYRTARPIRSS